MPPDAGLRPSSGRQIRELHVEALRALPERCTVELGDAVLGLGPRLEERECAVLAFEQKWRRTGRQKRCRIGTV